jgi:RNA polymerase sigma factor (sigma-70 family)
MPLDHQKLLAGDPTTTTMFRLVARRWITKFFRKPSQLEDVTQSAMTEMLGKLRAGNIPDPEGTFCWVLTCANNAVRREVTRVRNHVVVSYESQLHCPSITRSSDWVRVCHDLQRVNALLEQCDAGARRLLEARACGYTYQEIAEEFGLGEAAARASITRLRKKLITQLLVQDKREDLRQQLLGRAIIRHQLAPRHESSETTS